jgi:hypothetical protein
MYVSENIGLGKVKLKIKWPGRLEKKKLISGLIPTGTPVDKIDNEVLQTE